MVLHTTREDPLRSPAVTQREGSLYTTDDFLGSKSSSGSSRRSRGQTPFDNPPDFGLRKEQQLPTRRGLGSSPVAVLWENRTTNVDVMSVSNTTRIVSNSSTRNSERRRIHVVLPYSVEASKAAECGIDLDDPPVSTALEVKLNEDLRAKRDRDLRRERQVFLSRLFREREDRVSLEAWAASRVQAVFRGFLGRPRPPRPRKRQTLTIAESNRRLISELQATLARAGLPMIPGLGLDGRKVVKGIEWGRARGVVFRGSGLQGTSPKEGLRRVRSQRHRAFEDEMATRITKVVRGFLERRGVARCRAVRDQKRKLISAVRIQRLWRYHLKRMKWHDHESGIMDCAATKIQAQWKGRVCRKELASREKEEAFWRRKTAAAITIQSAIRRRIATTHYEPKLTLGATRRKREERAAAESARPRRRSNRGDSASPVLSAVTLVDTSRVICMGGDEGRLGPPVSITVTTDDRVTEAASAAEGGENSSKDSLKAMGVMT